jgi:hypothetical protein
MKKKHTEDVSKQGTGGNISRTKEHECRELHKEALLKVILFT